MNRKYFYTFFLALFISGISYAHTEKDSLQFCIKKLIKGKRHESQIIGIGFPGYQWPYYLKFKKLATEKELIRFCNHSNGIIRAYAFQALLDTNIHEARKIFRQQKNTKIKVEVMHGCTYTGRHHLRELYEHIVFDKWGVDLACNGGAFSKEAELYMWFMAPE